MITIHPLEPGFTATASAPPPTLDAATQQRVDAVWAAETARQPSLFDGTIFRVDAFSPAGVSGGLIPFRLMLAQLRDAALARELGLRTLAVSGVVTCRDGIVMGRRAERLSVLPGHWEMVPAGGVDGQSVHPGGEVDLAGLVLRELAEEVGLPADRVASCAPLLAVECDRLFVYDIFFAIEVELGGDDIRRAWAAARDDEYSELVVVPRSGLGRFLTENGAVVEATLAVLAHQGLIG